MFAPQAVVAAAASAAAAAAESAARNRPRFVVHPLASSVPSLPAMGSSGFSVASYNMLLKQFDRRHYAGHTPKQYAAWHSHRLPLTQKVIDHLNADLVALQEASVMSFEEEFGAFCDTHGYGMVAPYDKAAFLRDIDYAKPALLYRSPRFRLIWKSYRSRVLVACLQDNLASATSYLFVVNVHLEGHPTKAAERFSQIKSAFGVIEGFKEAQKQMLRGKKIKQPPTDVPHDVAGARVVVCGDFNSGRGHGPHTLLRDGVLPAGFEDPWAADGAAPLTKADFKIPYALQEVTAPSARVTGTYRGSNPEGTLIDFLFASSDLKVEWVRPPCSREQHEAASLTGTPNEWHPSDHFPIGAAFAYPLGVP